MRKYQRGNAWYVDYPFNGRRIRYAVGDEHEADEVLERARYEIKFGRHRPYIRMLFEKLLEKYLDWAKDNKRPSSFKRDLTSRNILQKRFGGMPIDRITQLDLEQYMNQRAQGLLVVPGLSRKPRVSHATVNREVVFLRHAFKKAVEWGFLSESPFRNIKLLKEPPGRLRYPSPDEWRRLISAATIDLRGIILVAANMGLRSGEIFNLIWSDIDWTHRNLLIRDSKNHMARVLPIPNLIFNLFDRLHQSGATGYIFPGQDGQQRQTIRTAFNTALRKAGITDLHPHDLRHFYGTRLTNQGTDTITIQALMGHKSIKSTQRYCHPTDRHKRDEIERLTGSWPADGTNMAQSNEEPT